MQTGLAFCRRHIRLERSCIDVRVHACATYKCTYNRGLKEKTSPPEAPVHSTYATGEQPEDDDDVHYDYEVKDDVHYDYEVKDRTACCTKRRLSVCVYSSFDLQYGVSSRIAFSHCTYRPPPHL